jgi:hypothetical protein
MLFDAQGLLSDGQVVATTAVSTNTCDAGAARDMVAGAGVELVVQVVTTSTAAGAATLAVSIETDDNVSFSSPVTIFTSAAVPVAALVVGTRPPVAVAVPHSAKRFLRLRYTVTSGPFTGGALTAGLGVSAEDGTHSYPRAPFVLS